MITSATRTKASIHHGRRAAIEPLAASGLNLSGRPGHDSQRRIRDTGRKTARTRDFGLMAKEPTDKKTPNAGAQDAGGGAGAAGAAGAASGDKPTPTLNILAQYVKDLSFENPGAPQSLRGRDKAPSININVNVNANPIAEKEYDCILTLNAKAEVEGTVMFNIELVYGGVFRIDGFPQEHMLPILFIECPRLLFPFARQIVADATRQGGFPPLMIDPIDFAQMFQQRMAQEQAKAKAQVQTT
jgi:preprotein translocase subunit SecB